MSATNAHDRYIMTELVGIISKDVAHNMPGIDNITFKAWGISSEEDIRIGAQASYKDRGIYLNTNRGQRGMNTKIYELRSTFRHELIHLRDWDKEVKRHQAGYPYTFRDHANVYLEQMTYPEFSNAPEGYQQSIIASYVQRLLNQMKEKSNLDNLNQAIENFNKTVGKQIGAKLRIVMGGLTEMHGVSEIIVTFNGKSFPVSYEYISSPYK